jgi:predicted dehydrogenase
MLRTAIYGAGHWGTRLIASVQGQSSKIGFVTAITRDPAGKRPLADRFGLELTDSYEAVLADPAIGAVVLCTPHSHHAADIIAAAKAGKHVFVEKPFTLTRDDAEAAIAACKAAGVTLHVGFNRRYAGKLPFDMAQPAYVDMAARIAQGDIGRLRHIEGQFSGPPSYQIEPDNWRSNQIESPGGSMTARGVHVIDSMVNIAGLIDSVFAVSAKLQLDIDVDDTTACLLRFKSGATGMLATLHATSQFYRIHAFGSKGALEMRGETELLASDLAGNTQRVAFDVVDKERAELEVFADAVAGGVNFVIPPDEIVNNVAVMQAVAASARNGQSVSVG